MEPLDVRRTKPAESNAKLPLRETASQTAGPYVHIGCLPNMAGIQGVFPQDLISNGEIGAGEKIMISGQVFEGDRIVCKDIMLEFWQADTKGSYQNGVWHRAGTNLETGIFQVETIMPGAVQQTSGETLAPFINVWVVARGINIGLLTRIYFQHFGELNARDPHLALVPAERRKTLIARAGDATNHYEFDVHLQGANETVFFET